LGLEAIVIKLEDSHHAVYKYTRIFERKNQFN